MTKAAKTYPVPWQGNLILACQKCQRKLKSDPDLRALYKFKKTIKKRNKEHPDNALHVLNVPCMDLCPKNGVTICNPLQQPLRLSILRDEGDIEQLHRAFHSADNALSQGDLYFAKLSGES